MEEPERILEALETYYARIQGPLSGRRFLVTAGPTVEAIDPVRYISNYSTGQDGICLGGGVATSRRCGYAGERSYPAGNPAGASIGWMSRRPNRCMRPRCRAFDQCDGAVMCAAVADYRPAQVADQKIKKGETNWTLALEPTRDIARELGSTERGPLVGGFCLGDRTRTGTCSGKTEKEKPGFHCAQFAGQSGSGVSAAIPIGLRFSIGKAV